MTELGSALDELKAGRPIVIPTDTVYGLAASLRVPGAVRELFRLKGRPRDKAIPVLGPDVLSLEVVALFDERARAAGRLWPGPLTVVLPRHPAFEVDLGGTGHTVGVRVPAHDTALEILRAAGPLAVTSANLSGHAPVTTPDEARGVFGDEVMVADGGTCDGAPSTVVDLTGPPRVLRQGALSLEELQAFMS